MTRLRSAWAGPPVPRRERKQGWRDWEAFWLDEGARGLYAALHPSVATDAGTGVVLVPPLLHEMPRSRRFLTEVAGQLATMGLPCLRFDYYGTGDSSGQGEDLDFDSMHADLDLAVAALRTRTHVRRVVLLAWRAAALPVDDWLDSGSEADVIVLWEPIADGAQWLAQLEREDRTERERRPPLRPGRIRTARGNDGQLMGFAASPCLRRDLDAARLRPFQAPTWAVLRPDSPPLPIEVARRFDLPADAPTFDGGAQMEATFFLTPPLEAVVERLGHALLEPADVREIDHSLRA